MQQTKNVMSSWKFDIVTFIVTEQPIGQNKAGQSQGHLTHVVEPFSLTRLLINLIFIGCVLGSGKGSLLDRLVKETETRHEGKTEVEHNHEKGILGKH